MKLHLGCGKRYIQGFTHIDAVDYPHVDHVSQIDVLPYIADNSVDLIYACHVLEHFKRSDVARVLTEWKRVLKPNGILRLAAPNFAAVCEVYQKYGRLDLVIGLIFGRQDYLYNIHYNLFDYPSLVKLLKEVGFIGGGGGSKIGVMIGAKPNMRKSTTIRRLISRIWTRITAF
ncbi:MAG: methyltransferase domain-containing protein [Helicobacteraceae bacterium]|jgi:SAM-dependent methyltransferase|nr:methyltransferase domain-containing protein [Helicobacteraceae bacterium]